MNVLEAIKTLAKNKKEFDISLIEYVKKHVVVYQDDATACIKRYYYTVKLENCRLFTLIEYIDNGSHVTVFSDIRRDGLIKKLLRCGTVISMIPDIIGDDCTSDEVDQVMKGMM